MPDTSEATATIRHLISTGITEQALLAAVARRFPELTPAELSAALQEATAAAERSALWPACPIEGATSSCRPRLTPKQRRQRCY